jgi:hypothetical protein
MYPRSREILRIHLFLLLNDLATDTTSSPALFWSMQKEGTFKYSRGAGGNSLCFNKFVLPTSFRSNVEAMRLLDKRIREVCTRCARGGLGSELRFNSILPSPGSLSAIENMMPPEWFGDF